MSGLVFLLHSACFQGTSTEAGATLQMRQMTSRMTELKGWEIVDKDCAMFLPWLRGDLIKPKHTKPPACNVDRPVRRCFTDAELSLVLC